jgi:hypothetical protein
MSYIFKNTNKTSVDSCVLRGLGSQLVVRSCTDNNYLTCAGAFKTQLTVNVILEKDKINTALYRLLFYEPTTIG